MQKALNTKGRKFCVVIVLFAFLMLIFFNSSKIEYKPGDEQMYVYEVVPATTTSLPTVQRSPSEDIAEEVPQLPTMDWDSDYIYSYNYSCAKFPDLADLKINNRLWQNLNTSDGSTFHLFGAYLDDRTGEKIVRVLAMLETNNPRPTYCHVWSIEASSMCTSSATYHKIWHSQWDTRYRNGDLTPYLISCKLAVSVTNPTSVSIVENVCDKCTTNLRINYNKPDSKKDFAVCVKGMEFLREDISIRLIEWIELLHILGASQIYIYNLDSHPNITKVLKHYEKLNKVQLSDLTLPGDLPNSPALRTYYLKRKINSKRRNEVIPYNDCFYKHMYEYRYISVLDVDEVIVPKTHTNLNKLINTFNGSACFYCARNAYFLDVFLDKPFANIPPYMHMLQNVYRTFNYTNPNYYVKGFLNTEDVLTVHNHFPTKCLRNMPNWGYIDENEAALQHYRTDCKDVSLSNCTEIKKKVVMDNSLWMYKDELIKRVNNTLKELNWL